MDIGRILRHLLASERATRRAFPEKTLSAIERAIHGSEKLHSGELRFVVEGGLDLGRALRGMTPRERAIEVFSELHVWDTEYNSGVLIYVQLVDHTTVVLADRGIARRAPADVWKDICDRMDTMFHDGRFEEGALAAIAEITELLQQHFAAGASDRDELVNRPVIL